MPPSIAHIWEFFIELQRRRKSNGYGPIPLQYVDIEAWERLTHRKLDLWELQAILGIDDAYLIMSGKKTKQQGAGGDD